MDFKILVAVSLFVLLYNLFLFGVSLNIGWGLLFLILNITFWYIRRSDYNVSYALIFSGLAVIFGLLVGFRDNEIVQIANFLTGSFLSVVAFYLFKLEQHFNFSIPAILFSPLSIIIGSLAAVSGVSKTEVTFKPKDEEISKGLLKGILIALPLVTILTVILMRADPVFEKLTRNILNNIGERVVISVLIFISLFVLVLAKIAPFLKEKEEFKITSGKIYELLIILGGVITVFGAFIVVQFQYLFSNIGERELYRLGIQSLTYSEYINKGFFELLIASSISALSLIYVLSSLHKIGNQRKLIQLFSTLLNFETGILLLSAAKRNLMYADEHGLTRARIFGFVFLIWLALILVVFLFRIFMNLKRNYLFTPVISVTLFALLTINIVNIDELIATKYKPTVNNEIDYLYISSLSADSYISWKEVIEESIKFMDNNEQDFDISADDSRKRFYNRTTLANLAGNTTMLITKYGTLEEILSWHEGMETDWINKLKESKSENDLPENIKRIRAWQDANLSEYRAYRYIVDDKDTFFKIPILYRKAEGQNNLVPKEVKEFTPIDRSLNPPLTR